MIKSRFIISITLIVVFFIITSFVKNKTRIIEKQISILKTSVSKKKNNVNEAQLEFYYLTSPREVEKKIKVIGFDQYHPIHYSNIYFSFQSFKNNDKKISNLNKLNEKKIQNK